MRLTGGTLKREYSITSRGNYVETMRVPGHMIQRTTTDLAKFMMWMRQHEPETYRSMFEGWWERGGNFFKKCGHFNVDLYRRILKVKKDRGEIF